MIRYWNIHDWMRAESNRTRDASPLFRDPDGLVFQCLHGNDPIWCRQCEEMDAVNPKVYGWSQVLEGL